MSSPCNQHQNFHYTLVISPKKASQRMQKSWQGLKEVRGRGYTQKINDSFKRGTIIKFILLRHNNRLSCRLKYIWMQILGIFYANQYVAFLTVSYIWLWPWRDLSHSSSFCFRTVRYRKSLMWASLNVTEQGFRRDKSKFIITWNI